ncbi:MAG TPA: nucleotidyltransferase domain-containing protein [Planctomycetota bacterium]|nr:nucleotidyltransferase domain-containing protein [Planctomycetota bacterium]HRR78958.1 nucleotidyltransferase domain-containing protein [Planctomycetota bacterium]HRT96822.1 nucleotidyltransferase domain-containing protein [Planctomycetota bacterium]
MLENLFGSRLRAKVLGWFLSHPEERFFVRQLESLLREDSTNLSRELARLSVLGILLRQTEGRQRYYRTNRRCPIFPDLQQLVLKTCGVADVLRAALKPLGARIRSAFVFGSVAKGEPRAESDIDLLVVGDVTLRELVSALGAAQHQLGREVNPTVYSPSEFAQKAAEKQPFVRDVLRGPKLLVVGDEHELAGLGGEPLAR